MILNTWKGNKGTAIYHLLLTLNGSKMVSSCASIFLLRIAAVLRSCVPEVGSSVTKFVEISPLWQYCLIFKRKFDGQFSILHYFEPT